MNITNKDIMDKLLELEAKMDAPKSLQRICTHCGGDGQKDNGEEIFTCPDCNGRGHIPFARITAREEE